MTPLPPARLSAIQARRKAATGGEWTYSVDSVDGRPCTLSSCVDSEDLDIAVFDQWDATPYEEEMIANAEFIIHAPEDVDSLIAEVERLKGLVKKAHREGMQTGDAWCCSRDFDDANTLHLMWESSEACKALGLP